MIPDITFGMPLGILRDANDGMQPGVELSPPTILQEGQAHRRLAAAEDEFRPFFHQAFRRKISLRELGAERDRLRRDREFEARRELHRAEDAQRVFGELIRDMAETLGL